MTRHKYRMCKKWTISPVICWLNKTYDRRVCGSLNDHNRKMIPVLELSTALRRNKMLTGRAPSKWYRKDVCRYIVSKRLGFNSKDPVLSIREVRKLPKRSIINTTSAYTRIASQVPVRAAGREGGKEGGGQDRSG